MPNTVKVLKLTTDEKSSLECLLRCPTTEARKYIRAKILLLKSDSYTNEAIADKLDITVPTVRLCLQKYFAGGIDNALNDCKEKVASRKYPMMTSHGWSIKPARSRWITVFLLNFGIPPALLVLYSLLL